MLSFKPAFSLSCFTFIKRLFSSSSLSATRVLSSEYLRLLIFSPAILIPVVIDSSWHFTWCTLQRSYINRVTIYSLVIFLSQFSQFWNSQVPCPCEVFQSYLTLCNPMDCSLPGFSVHGISQARVMEWVCISFSIESSRTRNWALVSHIAGRFFTVWATRVFTFPSWPAFRFLRRQIRWSYISISLRIFLNLLWSTQSKALV